MSIRISKSDFKTTQINDIFDWLAINRVAKKKQRKRVYNQKGNADEWMINDYSPALLLANEANVDVRFIGHLVTRLPYYITEYMTKLERAEQD